MQWINKIKEKIFPSRNNEDSFKAYSEPRSSSGTSDEMGKRKTEKEFEKTPAKNKRPKFGKQKYIANFTGLIDVVEDNGRSAFLVKRGERLILLSEIEIEGKTFYPPPKDKIPWILPNGDEIIELYEKEKRSSLQKIGRDLFEDLISYLKSISELPDTKFYELNAAWIIHTYLLDAFQYTPIIWFFAVPERGKSRTGKGMIYLAYRGLVVESLREAYLLRVSNDLHGSLFFDVRDLWKKALRSGTDDILLLRIERGARVPRVVFPDKGSFKDTVYYKVFGPTIIGTNRGVDPILETRAIQTVMKETAKVFENDVTEELALPLKTKLLAFKARQYGDELPVCKKPAPGRLGDITKPLCQVIKLVAPEREHIFHQLVSEILKAKLSDKSQGLHAEILLAIVSLKEKVKNSHLPVKEVTEQLNRERSDSRKISPQKVGVILKSLGIKTTRTTKTGGAAIPWNEDLFEHLLKMHGIEGSSESSESSESGEMPKGQAEDSEESEELDLPF